MVRSITLSDLSPTVESPNCSHDMSMLWRFWDAVTRSKLARTDDYIPASAGVLTTIAEISQRGFTFHTHLEASSLIHMNGRVADGLTGRFLSADPT